VLVEYVLVLAVFVAFYLLFFSPVLPSGRLLAPGDGANNYLPAVIREWSLWTDLIFAGYPAFADPQFLTWYPLRLLGHHYNALVVSAYVIASFTTYGYVRLVAGSAIAGFVAGLVYGCGGFMTAHLGHLTIIHSAAWIPLTLWGLELLARHDRWRPGVLVAGGIALSCFGGHPQPWVYGLLVSGAYVLWRSTTMDDGRLRSDWRYLWRAGASIGIGLLITSIQLVPLGEFAELTVRGQWTFADFTSYSLPFNHLLLMLFPNLFGNVLGFYPYFGEGSPTELSFYAGVIPLLLAWLACWQTRLRKFAGFWILTGLLALIFMLGDATPVAWLAFHIPVLGHFRAPARAGMIFIMAIAMLAGIGTAALQRGWISNRQLRWALLLALLSFAVVLSVVATKYKGLSAAALMHGIVIPTMLRNSAVWLPCLFFATGLFLCYWTARTRTLMSGSLLLLVVVIDVASFGWFYEWRTNTIDPAIQTAAPSWLPIIRASQHGYGRILPVNGVWSPAGPAKPNVNLIFGLASASGYGPLLPSRYAALTGIDTIGQFRTPTPESVPWPLLGVRWLLSTNANGEVVLGSGCAVNNAVPEIRLRLPRAIDIAAVRIVSQLACSIPLADDAPVIDILSDTATSPAAILRAGRDTAEWSWDAPQVRTAIRHRRAAIADSFAGGGGFQGHWYRGLLEFTAPNLVEHSITLRTVLPAGTVIRLRSVSVIDRHGNETSLSLLAGTFAASNDWSEMPPPPGFAFAEEYRHYVGRAWLVGATTHLTDTQALKTVQSGSMPDGQPFSSIRIAIVDNSSTDSMRAPGTAGSVDADRFSPDHWRFRVHATRPAMLVLNQIDYPGWQTSVNGTPAKIHRADYAFQAITVPSGESEVDLRFRPRSLSIGGLLTTVGLLLLLLCAIEPSYKGRKKLA
jgi:hypothetical protein